MQHVRRRRHRHRRRLMRVRPHLLETPHSGIRRMADLAATIDDPIRLGGGDPNFTTPQHIIDGAAARSSAGSTGYAPGEGFLELREAVVGKLRRVTTSPPPPTRSASPPAPAARCSPASRSRWTRAAMSCFPTPDGLTWSLKVSSISWLRDSSHGPMVSSGPTSDAPVLDCDRLRDRQGRFHRSHRAGHEHRHVSHASLRMHSGTGSPPTPALG